MATPVGLCSNTGAGKPLGEHQNRFLLLSVRTVVGETLTFTEVPRNASVQELLEMARGAEEEFDFADSWANMDAEKESVPLQLGAKVAGPLLMLGKVQLEEAVVQEVQEAPQHEPELVVPEPLRNSHRNQNQNYAGKD